MYASGSVPADGQDQAFQGLLEFVRRERRLDCSQYRATFLARRLAVRLRATQCQTYREYLNVLRSEAEEFDALLAALTMNLPYFMRDRAVFEALRHGVLSPPIESHTQGRQPQLSIWSAGCATGEENYLVAVLLAGLLEANLERWRIAIHGGDVDAWALQRARLGTHREGQAVLILDISGIIGRHSQTRQGHTG